MPKVKNECHLMGHDRRMWALSRGVSGGGGGEEGEGYIDKMCTVDTDKLFLFLVVHRSVVFA